MRGVVAILAFQVHYLTGLWHRSLTQSSGNVGLPSRPVSEECARIAEEIESLSINREQTTNGIVGGVVVENDCRMLERADILAYKSPEEQEALCLNSCYDSLANRYSLLLEHGCYGGADEHESAAGRLRAGAFRLACQKTMADEYCIPLMGGEVADVADEEEYDLCDDVLSGWGCCFQNYRAYIEKHGSNDSITALQSIASGCENQDIHAFCPCRNNIHPGHTNSSYVTCLGCSLKLSAYVIMTCFIALILR